MKSLSMEHLRGEIGSIISEETFLEAPMKIAELFEEMTLDIRQEACLFHQALLIIKDMLEGDSYQGHSFDVKKALKYVNSALGIYDNQKSKIPQIVEREGKMVIEQLSFEELPDACDECGGYGIIGRDCKCVTVPTQITVIDHDLKAEEVQEEYNEERQLLFVKESNYKEEYPERSYDNESGVCLTCGYVSDYINHTCDDNYGCSEEIATGMRVQ